MDEKEQFPRFKKDDFGEGTGWLFAGGLVACSLTLIKEVENFVSNVGMRTVRESQEAYKKLDAAIDKMRDTINATMEAAYAPTSPISDTPQKDPKE